MPLPPVDLLSFSGMGVVGLFSLWKLGVAPRVARWRAQRTVAGA